MDMPAALVARLLVWAPLTSICSSRLHWGEIPQGINLIVSPSVRLVVISDPRTVHLKGDEDTRETRVQCDCMAGTYAEARAMAKQIVAATKAPGVYSGIEFTTCFAEGPRDSGEQTTDGYVFRASVDLLVWHGG